jgi:zinc and cadmium transporter
MDTFHPLIAILIFTFLGSIGALAGALALMAKQEFAVKISHYLTAFAAGVLLASAFFDLLPEALHEGEAEGLNIFAWTLAGLLIFFAAEQIIHWFHHHSESAHEHDKETKAIIPLIIAGDTIHNFVDGVVIAATFLVDARLGIITALAVAAHEVPQEIGDFALLLHKGLSRLKVILINIASAAAAFAGAIAAYLFGGALEGYIPISLSLTAGFFIYIATSDIIPEIHYEKRRTAALAKSGLLLAGVLVLYLVLAYLGHGE